MQQRVKKQYKGKVRAAAFVFKLKFEEVVEIKIGDKVESVKIQALQRHPAKNTPMHADFKRA